MNFIKSTNEYPCITMELERRARTARAANRNHFEMKWRRMYECGNDHPAVFAVCALFIANAVNPLVKNKIVVRIKTKKNKPK